MAEPSDALREFASQGRQLFAEYSALVASKRSTPTNVALGTDLLDYFFDLSGHKRGVARIGKGLAYSSISNRESQVRARYETWERTVRTALGTLSSIRERIPSAPNSHALVQAFARTQAFARLDTRLEHGVRLLEALAEEHIVRNEELPALKAATKRRRPSAATPTTLPRTNNPVLIEGKQILFLLGDYPSERTSIDGAISVYQSQTPDFGRQALNSCRTAIENLTKHLSGESEWSAGLSKVVHSETRRKTVKQVHIFLSGYGTHGTAEPLLPDVEMGLTLTYVAVRILLGSPEG